MDSGTLKIDRFFERDIIEFLDAKSIEQHGKHNANTSDSLYRNMQKELRDSKPLAAINILEEAVTKYNSLDIQNPYKDIIYNHILEMIELLKRYGKESSNPSEELKTVLRLIDESSELKEFLPRKIFVFQAIKRERAQKQLEEEEKKFETKGEFDEKIKRANANLFISLRKRDLHQAIIDYREVANIFKKYPSDFEEDKKLLYRDIIGAYLQIKKLKSQLASGKVSIPSPKHEEHERIDMNKIKALIEEIKKEVAGKDFHGAKSKIIELKHMAHEIPDTHLRTLLESKINTMNQKIDFVKRTAEQKT